MKTEKPTDMRNRYESPYAETICLVQMMTVCASNGETQDYSQSSIWDLGDENE